MNEKIPETFEITKNGHVFTLVKVFNRNHGCEQPNYDGRPNVALKSCRRLTERERLVIKINNGTLLPG